MLYPAVSPSRTKKLRPCSTCKCQLQIALALRIMRRLLVFDPAPRQAFDDHPGPFPARSPPSYDHFTFQTYLVPPAKKVLYRIVTDWKVQIARLQSVAAYVALNLEGRRSNFTAWGPPQCPLTSQPLRTRHHYITTLAMRSTREVRGAFSINPATAS